ncbi:DUF1828 domain-containing protein [Verticiella sediminum]|uniref:DUF1828 domain-containing protein n=1 Tax=Verticiella sediminum TaxID=1247510 RepID=A0A556B0G3_9BURK|nr:DUF1828 domain-containing protein [Verticiella sediminum]TSH98660.1 DUF1828 domain-containing protein [Verticiella sediminum]
MALALQGHASIQFDYDCVALTGLRGESAFEVGTPFSFADGTAIVLYLLEENQHVLVSDNGDTMAHLSSMGLEPYKHRRLNVLRERVAPFGYALGEKADFRVLSPRDQVRHAFSQGVAANAYVRLPAGRGIHRRDPSEPHGGRCRHAQLFSRLAALAQQSTKH